MSEKNEWEVNRLKEKSKEDDRRFERNEKELRQLSKDFENFRTSVSEKMKIIFESIEEIKQGNRWISRSFIYLLFTGVIGALSSLIVWLIQR